MATEPTLDVLFDRAADAAMAALPLPGAVGKLAEVAAIAFQSAAKMARDGLDPVDEFSRMHGSDPLLRTLARFAEDRFPQSDPAPSGPDTVPFSDPPDLSDEQAEDSRP